MQGVLVKLDVNHSHGFMPHIQQLEGNSSIANGIFLKQINHHSLPMQMSTGILIFAWNGTEHDHLLRLALFYNGS